MFTSPLQEKSYQTTANPHCKRLLNNDGGLRAPSSQQISTVHAEPHGINTDVHLFGSLMQSNAKLRVGRTREAQSPLASPRLVTKLLPQVLGALRDDLHQPHRAVRARVAVVCGHHKGETVCTFVSGYNPTMA